MNVTLKKAVFLAAALFCLLPFVSSSEALFLGIAISLVIGNPLLGETRKLTPKLLQAAVVALGAGMNLRAVVEVGAHGLGFTAVGIAFALGLGALYGRLLGTPRDPTLLVSVGTAICGGSAIAAVSPVIGAKHHDVSVSLAVVFLLNSVALILFPPLGHFFGLSQVQFGLWAALAIHDTSSVVGAGLQYGSEALRIATTVKLARALWIVPVTFAISFFFRPQGDAAQTTGGARGTKPWFILGFVLMAALFTFVPALADVGVWIDAIAKRALVITLFLIGASLTRETLRAVGFRPLVHGVLLWITVGSATLAAIRVGWIS